jgi:hypothetical protein
VVETATDCERPPESIVKDISVMICAISPAQKKRPHEAAHGKKSGPEGPQEIRRQQ